MDFESQRSDFGSDLGQSPDGGHEQNASAAPRGRAAPPAGTGPTQVIVPDANGVVVLPEGVDLDAVRVVGRDLVIIGEDGTRYVVPDGAIIVPQLVVEGVAVPPLNLAALLTGNEPEPAAGPAQSSGGNFASPVGPIQAAFGLGDLLPYTELGFDAPREPEVIPQRVDREPDVIVITPDQPAGATSASAEVSEAGLPARAAEPAGTNAAASSETTTGQIVYGTPDGFGAIAINGIAITAVGQTITSANGVLTITSVAPGVLGYSYTLTDNLLGQNTQDQFAVTVTDADGDIANATLTISVNDDAPIAADDTDRVAGGTYGPETGNVITGAGTTSGAAGADQQGADGARVSGIANAGGSDASFDAAGNLVLAGQYGTLTMRADGSYSYVRAPGTPGGVSESFTYTLTDGDGSSDTATLTISIADSPATVISLPIVGAGTVVDEAGLPARTGEAPGTEAGTGVATTIGTIVVTAPDGPATVTIGGVVVTGAGQQIAGPSGTLTITSYDPATGTIGYSFTLTDNTAGDTTSVTFPVTVTDVDGDTDTKPLTITIVDDAPTANDDTAAQAAENAPVIIAVLPNDLQGADSVKPGTVTLVPGTLTGTGALANNDDGSFTYTPGANEQGTVTFDYTITDGDGDTSTATVTITLAADSVPTIALAGDTEVLEAGLPARGGEPAGTQAAGDGEFAAGTIAITTGSDTIGSLTANGVNVTAGGSVTTASGVLTVTPDGAGGYTYSYQLTDNTLTDPSSDSFALVITDSDGSTAATTLVIAIVDDAPAAADDAAALAAGSYGPAGGNVLANDTQGADGAAVVSYNGAGASGAAGTVVQGAYGTLTIAADGTFAYTRDAGSPAGVSDSFTYTIRDGDGDEATATLTVTIPNSVTTLDVPTAGEAGTQVLEAALPTGSDPANPGEATSGTIAFTAPDGPAILTIAGQPVAAGAVITGTYGTLTINAVGAGTIDYTYLLTTNTSGDATADDFLVRVEDQDGDFTEATVSVAIVDDVPAAAADTDSVTEDGPLAASGNLITDAEANGDNGADTPGADGATITAYSGAGGAGAPGDVISGLYGTLTVAADGSYTYTLDNANPLVQGLDGTEQLTDSFSYTITDGDGDDAAATLTITVNGADDPVVITGLNPAGAELTFDEDDLSDGSSPDAALLTQGGTFAVTAQDGLATIAVGGVQIYAGGAFVPGQSITTAYGTLTFTAVTPIATDANGDVTAATVSYSYTLNGNTLTHTGANDAALTDSYTVTVTDTDGSVGTDTLEVTVIDDVPAAADDSAGQATENVAFTIDALANDTFGADRVDPADPAKVFVSAQAAQGTVTYDPATGLFTYTPNPGAGAASTTDSFQYTIIDADGDSATATVTVTLQPDSLPTGGTVTATVDDDGLADGNPASTIGDIDANAGDDPADVSEASFTGTLAFNAFADAPATVAFAATLDGSTATVGLETVTFRVAGSIVTAEITSGARSGTDLFEVELLDPATGAYQVRLLTNVLNAGGPNNEATDATAAIAFTVTDADGSTAATTLAVVFNDDAPTASDNTGAVGEGGSTGGNVLSDGVADDYGADGGRLLSFSANGQTVAPGGSISTPLGTLTLLADGSYTYVSKANSTNTDTTDSFTYTIVDGDGDTATATLVIAITNAAGQVTDTDVSVDESGLDTATYHGSQIVPNGEFGSGAITVTGAAGTLVYSLTGANASGDGTYGTLVLDSATGTYTYTLDTPFTDAVAENSRNVINGAESFTYEVRDTNGNLIGTGAIQVNITDDVPSAVADAAVSVAEDFAGTIGGNVTGNDTPGADGARVTAVIIDGTETAVAAAGTTSVTTAKGVYTFQASGAWTFDPAPGQNQTAGPVDASFTYRLTDGDGDFSQALQPIAITDGAGPANPAPVILTLDDQLLADGSTPAAVQPPSTAATITFAPGSDAFAGIVFGDTAGLGGGLTWVRVDDTHITGSDGGRLVVTLTLSVTGNQATVTATLADNYLHANGGGDQTFDFGNAKVIATDIDGDTATALVDVRISDDLPTLAAAAPTAGVLQVDETVLGTDASVNFAGLFTPDYNADGAGSVGGFTLGIAAEGAATGLTDTATGEAVVLHMAGTSVIGWTAVTNQTVFVISLSGSTVTFDQQRAVVHTNTASANEPTPALAANLVTLSAVVTDADGDTATATAQIGGAFRILDDGPRIDATFADGDAITLTTQDADTIGAAFDTATASFAGAFSLLSSSGGADGTKSIGWDYSLVLEVANGAASGLASNGQAIYLFKVGTTVIGTTSATNADPAAVVFDLAVNAAGTVTLHQYAEIDHAAPGSAANYDAQVALLPTGLVSLQGNATITDGDNDTASDAAKLDLGGNVRFADDGPAVSTGGAAPALVVDESTLATNATASFAGLFTADYGADGPSAPPSLTYTLAVKSAGVASGLTDTATGNAVLLYLEGGQVVGRAGAGGPVVFTLAVDAATGSVTLDQSRAVVHTDTASFDEGRGLAAADLIQLTATAKDGDLDTAANTVNIGGALTFKDDGPSAGVNAAVQLDDDTLAGGNPGGTGDDPDPAPTTVAGTLAHGFGADGAGSVAVTAIGAMAGFQYQSTTAGTVQTTLIQQNQGGTFVTVATLTVDTATGAYTVVQNRPVLHADGSAENNVAFTVTYTVTDGDNDPITGTLSINIDDDTPIAAPDSANVTEGATVAGTVLANDQFGADGPAAGGGVVGVRAGSDTTTAASGSLGVQVAGTYGTLTLNADGSYSYKSTAGAITANATDTFVYTIKDADGDLSTTTLTINLADVTLTGQRADVLVYENALDTTKTGSDVAAGTVTGTTPASTAETAQGTVTVAGATGYTLAGGTDNGTTVTLVGAYGTLVITKATGAFTYTLTSPFTTNPAANDGVTTQQDAESFTYTATDANGNSTTGQIFIDIVDDVPTAVVPGAASGLNAIGSSFAGLLDTGAGSDGNVDNNYGADGGKAVFTAATITALQSQNLTSGLTPLVYSISADGTVLTAAKSGGGGTVFTITLDPAAADDRYVVDIVQKVDSTQTVDFNGGGYNFVGGNGSFAGFASPAAGSQDLLLTPIGGGTVNTNANEGGVGGGNSVGSGEAIRVDFVIDLTGAPVPGGNFADPADQTQSFTSHYLANGANALFTQITSTTSVKITAFDDADTGTIKNVGDGTLDPLTQVGISYNGQTALVTASGSVTVGGHLFTVTFAAGSATVTGVVADTRLAGYTATGYNSIEFAYAGGNTFKIGDFGATTITNQPVSFTSPISLLDGDGDITPSGNLAITLNPSVPPIVLDLNGDGVHFLPLDAGIMHDYGAGAAHTAWAGPEDGILAIDANGDGRASGSEIAFGSAALSDLAGLAAQYDSNHDGVLDAADAAFAQFGVWQDANSNGVADAGEFLSLGQAGIAAINLASDGQGYTTAGGDVAVAGTGSFVRTDGSTGLLADAAFATREAQRTGELVTTAAVAGALASTSLVAAWPTALAAGEPEAAERALPMVATERASLAQISEHAAPASDPAALLGAHEAAGRPAATGSQHTQDAAPVHQLVDPADYGAHPAIGAHAGDDASSAAASPPAALFAGSGTEGLMQALMALAPAPAPELGDATMAALGAPLAGALADLAGGAMVDAIVDHFAGAAAGGPAIGLAAGGDLGLHVLSQGIDGSAFAAMHPAMPDALLDASQLAAAAHA